MESNQKTILNIWQLVTLLNEMHGIYAQEAKTQVYTQWLQGNLSLFKLNWQTREEVYTSRYVVTTGKLM